MLHLPKVGYFEEKVRNYAVSGREFAGVCDVTLRTEVFSLQKTIENAHCNQRYNSL